MKKATHPNGKVLLNLINMIALLHKKLFEFSKKKKKKVPPFIGQFPRRKVYKVCSLGLSLIHSWCELSEFCRASPGGGQAVRSCAL